MASRRSRLHERPVGQQAKYVGWRLALLTLATRLTTTTKTWFSAISVGMPMSTQLVCQCSLRWFSALLGLTGNCAASVLALWIYSKSLGMLDLQQVLYENLVACASLRRRTATPGCGRPLLGQRNSRRFYGRDVRPELMAAKLSPILSWVMQPASTQNIGKTKNAA